MPSCGNSVVPYAAPEALSDEMAAYAAAGAAYSYQPHETAVVAQGRAPWAHAALAAARAGALPGPYNYTLKGSAAAAAAWPRLGTGQYLQS